METKSGAPPARRGCPARKESSVRLLAQEGGDVVLVYAALLQGLDGRGAIATDHRRHGVELLVVHWARKIVGSSLLRDYELRLGLTSCRHAEAGGHHRDAQLIGKRIVVNTAVDDG